MIDQDGDGSVRLAEIFDTRATNRGDATGAPADWLRDVQGILHVGAGNEDTSLAAVQLPAVQDGDPRAAFFNFDVAIGLTHAYVTQPGAEASLVVKLEAAKHARTPELQRFFISLYMSELARHVNGAVSRFHQGALNDGILIGLLLPAV
jgi:hypothetical protein